MNCPDCSHSMLQQRYEGVMVDHCHKCGGTWLDHGEIEKIVDAHAETFDEQAKIRAIAAKGKDHRNPRNLRCPTCQAVMEKFQYMFNSGVYIDRCPRRHGIYFDHGELEKVQIVMEEVLLRSGKHSSQLGNAVTDGRKVCPRDGVALREVSYETERVDLCERCGGIWCDQDEIGRLTAARLQRFRDSDFADIRADEASTRVVPEIDLCISLNCAVCRKPMVRHNYGYNSGIVIDGCADGHGIWLDRDELERVQVFIERWENAGAGTAARYQDVLNRVQADASGTYDRSQAEARERGRSASIFGTFVGKIIK